MIITGRIVMIKTIITIKALRRLLRFPASPKATFGNIEPSLDRHRHHENDSLLQILVLRLDQKNMKVLAIV